ncbi:hypothetical protein GF323_02595 [Candidatus Woesearchaeota archaeon]|nr:hypothetical protein [Candidatus Woesearchaeota archaeon]
MMVKLHTRVKRKLGLITSRKHRFRNVKGKKGAKTFLSEEKARKYALEIMKLNENEFGIIPAKRNKKFRIVKKAS